VYGADDLFWILWRRKWLMVAGMVVFAAGAFGVAERLPNLYRSETLILVIPQRIPESYVRSTVTMRIEDRLRSISQEILSRTRLERIIDEFNLYPDERKTMPIETVVARMRDDIDVETVRDDAFKVSYTSRAPRTAMIVTERLASMVIDENLRDREVVAEGTNRFLESQLEDARQRLKAHEKKLEEFRRRYAGELPAQLQTNLQMIQGVQNQIQSLTESINRDRDRRLVLEKSIADALAPGGAPAAPPDEAASAELRTIDQLERARDELHTLEGHLKPEHPDVIAKRRAVADLEKKLQQETASGDPVKATRPVNPAELARSARARQNQIELDKLDRQIAQKEADVQRLRQTVTDYQHRVDAVPGHESELTELMRDYETLQKIYSGLLANHEASRISASLERLQVGEQFKILDPAKLPQRPFSPNRLRIVLLGMLGGLVAGVAFAAFLEYRDTTLRSEDDIVRALALPVLAAIPIMVASADRRRQRRTAIILTAAAATLLVAGAAAAAWRFGLLGGLR
jgi:polysaccharide chain length determinant protein (PEP-CTERM system associated)